MLRSRRFAFISSVVVLGLASTACGDDRRISGASSTNAGATPPVIRVGSGSGSTRPMSSESDSKMMAPYGQTVYIYDGDLPELGGTARAWRFPAGAQAGSERVAAIAAVLGVEGEVRSLPADEGGGWMVGPADYSGANLSVATDGMLSWWFSPSPDVWGSGVACAEPDYAPLDTTVDSTVVETFCEEPLPPANVPDEATALQMAEELFAELGYDVTTLDFDAYADEWGANVAAYVLLDGGPSPMSMSVGFGPEGAVTWASGFLAEPEVVGEYPMVGSPAGLLRLQDENSRWMWYGAATARDAAASDVPVDYAFTEAAPVETVPLETLPGETIATDTVPVETMPVDTVPGTDVPAETIPVDTVPMEIFEIHLVGVHLGLTMVWDVDGTVWLLPAYVFTTADGGEFAVVGIEDGFIELPEALPVPEPLPAESAESAESS